MRDVVTGPTRCGSPRTDGRSRRSISRRPPWLTRDRRPRPLGPTSPGVSTGSKPISQAGPRARVVTTWSPACMSTLRDRWRRWCGGWGPESHQAEHCCWLGTGRSTPLRESRRTRPVRSRSRSKQRSPRSIAVSGRSMSLRTGPGQQRAPASTPWSVPDVFVGLLCEPATVLLIMGGNG
jgi:hypothetical protein